MKNMKKLILCLCVGISLISCQGRKSLDLPANTNAYYGLNSTITLYPGINSFLTKDYVLDPTAIDSVSCDSRYVFAQLSEDKLSVKLNSNKTPQLTNIALWVKGVPYSILAKRTDEKEYVFKYNPHGKKYDRVQLAGQMNDWVPSFHPDLTLNSDSIYEVAFRISPGTYLYQLVRDGEWNHDETNPEKVDNNSGKFNSVLHIPSNQDKAPILLSKDFNNSTITLDLFNETEQVYVYWQNYLLPQRFTKIEENSIVITLPTESEELKRSYIRVFAANKYGISNDILVPLENGKVLDDVKEMTRFDKHGEIIYSLMVDRFKDGKKENNHPMNRPDVNPKVDYFGGDLVGITQKIKDGYFNKLGFTTLWISPIVQNPLEPYAQLEYPVKTKFSGYHGYWPISSSKIDFRLGTDQEMQALMDAAHSNGINVILDYVANHVHKNHSMFKNDPTICTPLILPDGTKNLQRWNDQRLTTWFDEFLPTLDYSRQEIVEAMTDSALYWVKKFNLDGFRHDACKHVQEEFWRTLTYKLKTEVEIPENRTIYQIGESYGSPQLIRSYVNSGMLDGQFDFNVSDDASSVFSLNSEDFRRISNTLNMSLKVYGNHSLMGYISGNHDRARFISYASGDMKYGEDSKAAGWLRNITVSDTTAYDKLIQLNAFNMTIPGVPVVYYGDEIGDPGANDPDCRRMMRFNEQLNKHEQRVLETVSRLGQLRKSNLALIYGDFIELKLERDVWVYARNYFGEIVIVVFNRNTQAKEINVTLPKMMNGIDFKATFGNETDIEDNTLNIKLPANGIEILTMQK